MHYENDYVMRLIEQMGGMIRRALERLRLGADEEPYELTEAAIGLALDMDPATVLRMSPQSLVSLIEIGNLDDRVVALIAEAIEVEAEAYQADGDLVVAGVRREQAAAVRSMLSPQHAN